MTSRRCVVVSVGLGAGDAKTALFSVGLSDGDAVVLVGSEPREVTGEAVESVRKFLSDAVKIDVREVWLDPTNGVAEGVATVRSVLETLSPCAAVIADAGGPRWLSAVLTFLAVTLKTVGKYVGIGVERVLTVLEEDVVGALPGAGRVVEWVTVPPFLELQKLEYTVLRLIAGGLSTAREIHSILSAPGVQGGGVSMIAVQRALMELRRKRLVKYERVSRTYRYELTDFGKMLAGTPRRVVQQ